MGHDGESIPAILQLDLSSSVNMDRLRVVDHALPETPESLYHQDRARMEYEAFRRSLDPETLAMIDKLDEEVTRQILGLPREVI